MKVFTPTINQILLIALFFICCVPLVGSAQVRNEYEISFENAVHHEATVHIVFRELETDTVSLRMSTTFPDQQERYGFASNLSGVSITDGNGKKLAVRQPKANEWEVAGHNGTLFVSYSLFGDYGDGIHNQINSHHAILNPPATFMHIPAQQNRPIQLNIITKRHPEWEVATPLISKGGNSFLAPDLNFFMDSPILIGTHTTTSYTLEEEDTPQNIRFVWSRPEAEATEENEATFTALFESIRKMLEESKKIFGAYPVFDFGEYTFLMHTHALATPNQVSHRNANIITASNIIHKDSLTSYMYHLTYNFLKSWNPKRLRTKGITPASYDQITPSHLLWFTEGFIEYYTYLILKRMGLLSTEQYFAILAEKYNEVWTSTALSYSTCLDLSIKAPLIQQAAIPTGTHHSSLSYQTYGHMLALALDLSLRQQRRQQLDLNGFMTLIWNTYGTSENPFSIADLQKVLATYAGEEFAGSFFDSFIYSSQQPDYIKLFGSMGIKIDTKSDTSYFGADLIIDSDQNIRIASYVKKQTPAYQSGFEKNDILLSLDEVPFTSIQKLQHSIATYPKKKAANIAFRRDGKKRFAVVRFQPNPNISLVPYIKRIPKLIAKRKQWLN